MADKQIVLDIKVTNNLAQAQKKIEAANRQIEKHKKIVTQLEREHAVLKAALDSGAISLGGYIKLSDKLNSSIDNANETIQKQTTNLNKYSAQASSLQGQIANVTAAQIAFEKATTDTQHALNDLEKSLEALKGASLDGLDPEQIKLVEDAVKELKLKIDAAKESMVDLVEKGIKSISEGANTLIGILNHFGVELEACDEVVNALGKLVNTYKTLEDTYKKLQGAYSVLFGEQSKLITAKFKLIAAGMKEVLQSKINTLNNYLEAASNNKSTVAKYLAIIAIKAMEVAQWLLNKAVLAFPVLLVVAGLALLISKFGFTSKASKEAAKAQEEYNKKVDESKISLDNLSKQHDIQSNKLSNQHRKQIQELKERGASEKEITDAELQNLLDKITAEEKYTNEKIALNEILKTEAEKLIKHYESMKELSDEEAESLKKLKIEVADYANEVSKLANIKVSLGLDKVDARQKNTDSSNKNESDELKKAQNNHLKLLDQKEKAAEAAIKAEVNYQNQDFATKQQYEQRLFNLHQNSQKEKLKAQKRYGDITVNEYNHQLQLLNSAQTQFQNNQKAAIHEHIGNLKKEIGNLIGGELQLGNQIADITKQYDDTIKKIQDAKNNLDLDKDDDANKWVEDENTIIRLLAEKEKLITDAQKQFGQKQFDSRVEELTKENEANFESFENNELEKLKLQRKLYQQVRDEQKALGNDTSGMDNMIAGTDKKIDKASEEENYKKQIADAQFANDSILEIEKNHIQQKLGALKTANLQESAEYAEMKLKLKEVDEQIDDEAYRKKIADAKAAGKSTYEIEKEALEKKKATLKEGTAEYAELLLQEQELDKNHLNAQLEKWEAYADTVKQAFSGIFDMMNAMGEAELQRAEEENNAKKEMLEAQLASGAISKKQYNQEIAKSDADLDKKKADMARKQAIRDKAMKVFEIGINTASAIIRAWNDAGPFGGPIFSAIIGAMGAMQMATVLASPLPKAETGGYIQGNSHATGGVNIEAEGGEYIINKKATAANMSLLKAINLGMQLPQSAFIPSISPFTDGGFAQREHKRQNKQDIDYDRMTESFTNAAKQQQISVSVEDINTMQKKVELVDSYNKIF